MRKTDVEKALEEKEARDLEWERAKESLKLPNNSKGNKDIEANKEIISINESINVIRGDEVKPDTCPVSLPIEERIVEVIKVKEVEKQVPVYKTKIDIIESTKEIPMIETKVEQVETIKEVVARDTKIQLVEVEKEVPIYKTKIETVVVEKEVQNKEHKKVGFFSPIGNLIKNSMETIMVFIGLTVIANYFLNASFRALINSFFGF